MYPVRLFQIHGNNNKNLATLNAIRVAATQGGAHNKRVPVLPNPMVALKVGKNALKLRLTTMEANANASHHTFQSVIAIRRAIDCVCPEREDGSWSETPMSSIMRFNARVRSRGVKKAVVVDGKSGRMIVERRATKTVNVPSV
jgi:hypothetical protein